MNETATSVTDMSLSWNGVIEIFSNVS